MPHKHKRGHGRRRSRSSSRDRSSGHRRRRSRSQSPPKSNYCDLIFYGGCECTGGKSPRKSKPKQAASKSPDTQLPDTQGRNVLLVESINLQSLENAKQNNTEKYDAVKDKADKRGDLVIRRGGHFTIKVNFNKPYDSKVHDLKIRLERGKKPSPSRGTMVYFLLSHVDVYGEWGAWIVESKGNEATIDFSTHPHTIIGEWKLIIETVDKEGEKERIYRYQHPQCIFILFNPWCQTDPVHMDNPDHLNEYVLNDTGAVYRGSSLNISAKPWNYGQFEEGILQIVLNVLEKAFNNVINKKLADPVSVCRRISQIVNEADDSGILEGNWSGNYRGGSPPSKWGGSVAILEQYEKTGQPVKYGQCWVFAAVTTTVCRALGIPARCVTNFSSAHDTDSSITIDKYFKEDEDGILTPYTSYEYSNDSIWNFHVWNDVWMRRADLKKDYDGWQAIDATPQEESGRFFCCGPSPLTAIKNGECSVPFDTPFVFAEVNGDRIQWCKKPNGDWEILSKDCRRVGKCISSFVPGAKDSVADDSRLDITRDYKYEEGTESERAAMREASKSSVAGSIPGQPLSFAVQDVEFQLEDIKKVVVGADIKSSLKVINTSKENRTIKMKMKCIAIFYTGIEESLVKDEVKNVTLKPDETREISWVVTADEYTDRLLEHGYMKIYVASHVTETMQKTINSDEFCLIRPKLTIKTSDSSKCGKPFKCEVSFTNPLKKKKLTECILTVEGPVLTKRKEIPIPDVEPNAKHSTPIELTSKNLGKQEIIVTFDCKELQDITGTVIINVVN